MCEGVQGRLMDALLAQQDAAAPDLAHSEGCDDCRALRDDLLTLRVGLDAAPAPDLSPEVFARTQERAFAALAEERVPSRAPLPDGFGRQLARVLAPPALLLPLVVLWNFAVLSLGGELLAGLVPAALLTAVGAAYAMAAGGSVALLFGSIPFVAQHEARRRLHEVTL
jgi:hypothetical protein